MKMKFLPRKAARTIRSRHFHGITKLVWFFTHLQYGKVSEFKRAKFLFEREWKWKWNLQDNFYPSVYLNPRHHCSQFSTPVSGAVPLTYGQQASRDQWADVKSGPPELAKFVFKKWSKSQNHWPTCPYTYCSQPPCTNQLVMLSLCNSLVLILYWRGPRLQE